MPAIRKIRIVNFRYNDGTTLIPDEIFCTENSEGKPIDTLLNLENGGGKSVIVQLMLQPVCPKAKVQGRSITDYFQRGTDHAFILIEWALDGSSNSLLTGIALAASTNADDEAESQTIRYYTFLHNYSRTGDRLDLINIPLSERTDNHIRAMSFDELRKFLQSRRVEYFPSDALRRYQKRLEEYGILYAEWEKILIPINAVEGGISNFFEEYKTSDSLLDRFIIPGVMPNDRSASEELEEMFLNYANSYAGQEENLRLQSLITSFTDKLQEMLPLMKNMWDAEDAKIQAIRHLANHLFTLEHRISQNTDVKAQLEATIRSLKEKLHHIQVEKASEAYYQAEEKYVAAERQLANTTQKKEKAKNQRDFYAHQVTVLNAAKEYVDLTKQQARENALYAQLRELEQGTMDAHILSLCYSLFCSASKLKNSADAEYRQEEEQMQHYSDNLQTIQQTISKLKEKLSDKTEKYNQAIGRKGILLEQINNGLDSLSLRITVMLDGQYSVEDIGSIRSGYAAQLSEAINTQEAYENEEQQLEQELASQDIKRRDLLQKQAAYNAKLESSQADHLQYEQAYNAAIQVTEHLSLPAERLFTDEPLSCLDRIVKELQEQLKKAERSAEQLAEQFRCMENGQLHLSKTAVGFLQETGIFFQTGEQYLLQQSTKVRETILAINPLAAYAVIVENAREQEKLLYQISDDTWLSAIVPIYTRSEIADMADENWNNSMHLLSAYDKAYFSNVSAYSEHVRAELTDVQTEIQSIIHQIEEWQSERNVLVQFSYSADAEQQILDKIDSYNNSLTDIQNKLSDLDNRHKEIQSRKKELRSLQDTQRTEISIIEQNSSRFESVCDIIGQYESLCTEVTEYEAICKQLSSSIAHTQEEEKQATEQIKNCEMKMKAVEEKLTEYRNLIEELKETPEAALISDDYATMLVEYRQIQSERSSDRQSLQNQIDEIRKTIEVASKALKRFRVEPEEYEKATYSDDAYQYADNQRKSSEQEYEKAESAYSQADGNFRVAENNLSRAGRQLKELNVEPLERSEVGSDFEQRIRDCETTLKSANTDYRNCEQLLNELNSDKKLTAKYIARFKVEIADYTPKLLEDSVDTNEIYDKIVECIDQLRREEENTKKHHRRELEPYRSEHSLFAGTLDGIASVIGNTQINGDRYYTLYERTEDDIRRYRERIEQLGILLRDVEDSRKQLVNHCLQRVGRLYENLTILSKKSGVQIGNTKKQMLRIELSEIDPTSSLPAERINQYIIEQVKKFLQEEAANKRRYHLEIRRLLNCYIGKESIPIIVYKIDKNVQNSRYRSWEDALKANSGGEQFVVLFSLVVSVMNYTRSMTENLNHTSGVLILDNPFGPISSPHLLEPMFRIAHQFHIQLICLTHLGTAAVTSCFDMVYQLRFKNLPLSNVEILESEAKQHMEYAYYLSEQLSLY